MGFDLHVPFAFPHDLEVVTVLPEEVVFLQSGFVHFLHGPVGVEDGIPVAVERKAARAPVPQAPVEFVDGRSTCDGVTAVETVDQVMDHAHFTPVSDSPDAIGWSRMLKAQEVFLPGQPFQGFEGLIGSGAVPPSGRSRGDGLGWNQFLSPETIAGGGDGHALFQGVKFGVLSELLTELLTAGLQQFDV